MSNRYHDNAFRVDDRPGTGRTRTLRAVALGDLTFAVTYRGVELARYVQSIHGADASYATAIHYRVTLADGRTYDTRDGIDARRAIGFDTPSILQRIWWDYNGVRPIPAVAR